MWWSPLASLKDPAVRELAAALLSPSLLTLRRLTPQTATWQPDEIKTWLNTLDQAPEELHQAVQPPAHRLGLHFERLLGFYLQHRPEIADLARNLQVRAGNGATLGEFDFLYRDNLQKGFCHLEVAIKFFLRPTPGRAHRRWVGPNPRDRLDIKRRHLLQRQLRLSKRAEGRATLAANQIEAPVPACLLKGCLCYPWEEFVGTPSTPWHAAPDHWKGWWVEAESASCLREEKSRYRILARRDWLSLTCEDNTQLLSWREFNKRMETFSGAQPVMVSRMLPFADCWVEQDRGFVVPKVWLTKSATLEPTQG